jgi:hypothetical protein
MNDRLIQLPIDGRAFYLNPAHVVALLPGSPSDPEVRVYLTSDALNCLPKANPSDQWVTLYGDDANALLKRFGLFIGTN